MRISPERRWHASSDSGCALTLMKDFVGTFDSVLMMMAIRSSDMQFCVKVCIDPFTEFVVFGSTVKEDVDDEAAAILEDRVCADAPRHESAEAFASSFRVENFGVAQKAADDGMLITEPLAVRRDEWSL